ncbi:MAG: PQQ-binding-like beta-propeller repeat protein [Acidobacteriota bacterium]
MSLDHSLRLSLRLALCAALVCLPAAAADLATSPQFRGLERDGVFPADGLLESWPADGPPMLWATSGLGDGYASISVTADRIFTTGKKDGRGHAMAFDRATGAKVWSTDYGSVHSGNGYPGTRTTPTYADGRLFLLSSEGLAVALDAASGDILWSVDILKTFGGPNLYFGISESPLVDGDRVIYTPGGKKGSIVALNVATGESVWQTEELTDKAAYCNPRIMEHGGHRQLVTLLSATMVGVDLADGSVLWTADYPATYDIHAVSPLFSDDLIFVSDGYGQGSAVFRLAKDGRSVEQVWKKQPLDIHHGGGVLHDGVVYGIASNGTLFALDLATGKELSTIRRFGKGTVIWADGHLIGYNEKGEIKLVDPTPSALTVVSSFEVEKGDGQHWAHPVIVDGSLIVRHGDALMAYDLRASTARADASAPAASPGR